MGHGFVRSINFLGMSSGARGLGFRTGCRFPSCRNGTVRGRAIALSTGAARYPAVPAIDCNLGNQNFEAKRFGAAQPASSPCSIAPPGSLRCAQSKAAGSSVLSMKMFDFANVVVMQAFQRRNPNAKPARWNLCVFLNRGDGWKIALSAQTKYFVNWCNAGAFPRARFSMKRRYGALTTLPWLLVALAMVSHPSGS